MNKEHPLSKEPKNDIINVDKNSFLDWLTFSEEVSFIKIMEYMSSKEYINKLYTDANQKQKYQVRVRRKKGDVWIDRTYKQFLNDEKITKDINKIENGIEIYIIDLVTSEKAILTDKKENLKKIKDKLDEEIIERIKKDSKDNISIKDIGNSTYEISDNNNNNIDVFKEIREDNKRGKNEIINEILKILYDILYSKFNDEKEYVTSFKEKTEPELKNFLEKSINIKDGASVSSNIKQLFPKNQQGIQGTLGEQFFASIISKQIEEISESIQKTKKAQEAQNTQITIMGQSYNALRQQAHIDIKIMIDKEIIGIQNKQYNSILNIGSQIYFYKQEYDVYGNSLIRYLSNKHGAEENAENIVKYLRCLANQGKEGYVSLDDEIVQILLPYFQNFSRISDPKAIDDLKYQKNNFFVYNFRLIPLSFIILQLINQIQSFNPRKKIESIGRDIFSLKKKYKGQGIPYDENTYIPKSKDKASVGAVLKFSGLPLNLGKTNLVRIK